jgi:hypothetical protein
MDTEVRVTLVHNCRHEHYVDVSMPGDARQFIIDNIDLTPGDLYSRVASNWPTIERYQVYHTWSRNAEGLWKRDDDPIISAKSLLQGWKDDVDLFDLALENDVIGMAWGIKNVAQRVQGMIVEIALDATCESFSSNFLFTDLISHR